MKNIRKADRVPARAIQSNPHQIPKIAPAASAKIDSGNKNVVPTIKRTMNKTGPQLPRATIKLSTLGM